MIKATREKKHYVVIKSRGSVGTYPENNWRKKARKRIVNDILANVYVV
jgi:hypothetical protein